MKTLKEFYQAYAAWLDAGAPEDQPFSRAYGLCDNLFTRGCYDILRELKGHFKSEGYDPAYPFGGSEVFETEMDNEEMHLNPERIKWVKDHAK
ncbi:hypothetical protein Pondi_00019 [Escherichia phage Pondi]|nr:hypothetical protein Pondi_00019 [Escherichia phage Pondi]